MSDKEAYELLVKYSGGEHTLTMIREMIHIAGIEIAVKNTLIAMSNQKKGKVIPEDFAAWVYQSFRYIQNQMQQPLN